MTAIGASDPFQALDLSGVTGSTPYDYYFAVKTRQGGRDVYTIQTPVAAAVGNTFLPVPDPDAPTPGNRRVNRDHARKFGKYIRVNPGWVAPALMVRAMDDGSIGFKSQTQLPGGIELGILAVPRSSATALRILDGQHRVLGGNTGWTELLREIERLEDRIARAKDGGSPQDRAKLEELREEERRFLNEHLTIQIYLESEPGKYEQMFYDVADNALGINQTVKVRFDSRKVVNRTISEVANHPLLDGRIDMEQDRIKGSNPNLLGAKHVADIVRSVTVGVVGRIGARREAELDDAQLVELTNDFLSALLAGFADPLERLVDGKMTPEVLRATSLLGSVTMLRVLAGAYHELAVRTIAEDGEAEDEGAPRWTSDQVQDFFMSLAPHMAAPVAAGSVWLATGDFDEGATGPRARSQNLRHLVTTIVEWATVTAIGAEPLTT